MAKHSGLVHLAVVMAAVAMAACDGNPIGPTHLASTEVTDQTGPTTRLDSGDEAAKYPGERDRVDANGRATFSLGDILPNPNNGFLPGIVPRLPIPQAPIIDPGSGVIKGILDGKDPLTAIGDELKGPVGIPLKTAILEAKRNAGPGDPFPEALAQELIRLGVRADLVRRTRWSSKWGAVDTLFTASKAGVALPDLIVVRDPAYVTNPTNSSILLLVHEFEHIKQYDDEGLDLFAANYTLNSAKYENQAEAAANRAADIMRANPRPLPPGGSLPVAPQPGFQPAPSQPMPAQPAPVYQSQYYSYCATIGGNSPVILGGLPNGASCWMPTPFGPVWGVVVGFFR